MGGAVEVPGEGAHQGIEGIAVDDKQALEQLDDGQRGALLEDLERAPGGVANRGGRRGQRVACAREDQLIALAPVKAQQCER